MRQLAGPAAAIITILAILAPVTGLYLRNGNNHDN